MKELRRFVSLSKQKTFKVINKKSLSKIYPKCFADHRGVFKALSNIYGWAFFAKIVSNF